MANKIHPQVLASLKDPHIKSSAADIAQALTRISHKTLGNRGQKLRSG
ncbi:hypothetical protein LC653_02195 [Nostoc sp. CHAB 5784]|nr:hypothetical protein [Nostoc mirabile]MCC5662772.1 hypothetical protein [Nostoc mirabile CHAB5784]